MSIQDAPNIVTSRRGFIRGSACAAGSVSMLSTLMGLRQLNAAAEGDDD